MAETDRVPFPKAIEVVPPTGMENGQPTYANWIAVAGGGAFPVAIDFFYLSAAFLRRISIGETGGGIERSADDRVVCRVTPAVRLVMPVPNAADLIVSLYANLQNEEVRAAVDSRLRALTERAPVEGST